jgi:hypothetical protein
MTDLVITPANVEQGEGAVLRTGIAAVAITAGQVLYRLSDGTLGLADADNATAAIRKAVGVAVNNAAAGQPVSYQTAGRINIGASVTQGEIYVLSGAAGGICPEADLGVGEEVVILGVGYTASGSPLASSEIELFIKPSGILV